MIDKDTFWKAFAKKHRPQTVEHARIFAGKRFTEHQFATLLSQGYERMSPSKARQIYRYLKRCGMLEYPDVEPERGGG